MGAPTGGPFEVHIDEQRLQRFSSYARRLLRDAPPPADTLAAEFVREITSGRSRPRDLLTSDHYRQILEPAVREAARRWQQISEKEHATHSAAADDEINRVLPTAPET